MFHNRLQLRLQSRIIHLSWQLCAYSFSLLVLVAGCGGGEDDFGPTASFDALQNQNVAEKDDAQAEPATPDPGSAPASDATVGPADILTNDAEAAGAVAGKPVSSDNETVAEGELPATDADDKSSADETAGDEPPQVPPLQVSGYLAQSARDAAVFANVQSNDLVIFNQYTGEELSRFSQSEEHQVSTIAISDDGSLTVAGLQDGSVKVFSSVNTSSFDVYASRRLQAVQRDAKGVSGHDGAVTQAVIFSDNQKAATAGTDGTVHLWYIEPGSFQEATLQPDRSFPAHGSKIIALRLLSENRLLSVGADGQIRVWPLENAEAESLDIATTEQPISAIAISANGKTIAVALDDGSVDLIPVQPAKALTSVAEKNEPENDLPAQKTIPKPASSVSLLAKEDVIVHPARVRCIRLSADSQMVITGCDDGLVRVWDIASRKLLQKTKPDQDSSAEIVSIGFPTSIAGRRYAGGIMAMDSSGVMKWWFSDADPLENDRTRLMTRVISQYELAGFVGKTGTSDASSEIVSPIDAKLQKLHDSLRTSETAEDVANRRQVVLNVQTPAAEQKATSESPSLAVSYKSAFDFQSGAQLPKGSGIVQLGYSADGTQLVASRKVPGPASVMSKATVHVWDRPTGVELRHWNRLGINAQQLQFVGHGLNIVTLPQASVLRISTGMTSLLPSSEDILTVVPSPDGRYFATGEQGEELSSSAVVRLYNAASMQEIATFNAYESYVSALMFSQDGTRLFAGIREKKAHKLLALDVPSLKSVQLLEDQKHDEAWLKAGRISGTKGVIMILSSLDERRLLTYSEYGRSQYRVSLWAMKNKRWTEETDQRVESRVPMLLPELSDPARFLDPRGTRLALATKTGYSILDLDEKKQEREIRLTPPPTVSGLTAISPDGSLLAMGTEQGKIQLWPLSKDKPMKDFQAHLGPVVALKFSPDGSQLATAGEENAVHVWELADWASQARRLVRN